MSYTKKTIRITKPSPRLEAWIKELRRNKEEQVQKLLNMKEDEFGYRVSL